MQHIITEFNYETGNIKIITPVPFTMDDLGINYRSVSRPKYEDKRSYNIFDLISENDKLKQENKEYKNVVCKLRRHLKPIYAKRGYCSAKEILIFLEVLKEE